MTEQGGMSYVRTPYPEAKAILERYATMLDKQDACDPHEIRVAIAKAQVVWQGLIEVNHLLIQEKEREKNTWMKS